MRFFSFSPKARRGVALSLTGLSSLLGIAGGLLLTGHGYRSGYSFVFIPLFGLLWVGAFLMAQRTWGRKEAYGALYSFLFLLCMGLGYRLQANDTIGGLWGWLLVGGTAACLTLPTAYGLLLAIGTLARWLRRGSPCRPLSSRRVFWLYVALLLLCWLPVFLAYYPGLFAYDIHMQTYQVLKGRFDTHHPLLHTLWQGLFYTLGGWLGSYTVGMALHALCQALLVALCLAYGLQYLYKLHTPRALRIGALAFFALCPIVSILAISLTKDVLFSALFVVVCVQLHRLWCSPTLLASRRFILRLVLLSTLFCLLRNNGVITLGLGVALFLLFGRGFPRKLPFVAVMACVVLAYGGSTAGLAWATQAKPGNLKEMLCVPMQQMARVYSLHQEDLDCTGPIEDFLPEVADYRPTMADDVKTTANVGAANMTEFLSLWGRLLWQYPGDYVDAFLWNSMGLWFVDDTSNAAAYGEALEDRQGYLLTDTKGGYQVEHTSYCPALEQLYERLFSANEYQSLPVLGALFCPALYFWGLLGVLFAALYRRQRPLLWVSFFGLGMYCSILLGPCALIRYMLPLVLLLPPLVGLLFSPSGGGSLTDEGAPVSPS